MAILARLLTLIIAYILACLAASIVLTVGTFVPQWPDPPSLDFSSAALWPVVGVGAAMIAGVAFLPVLLVITLAEGFAWRSILVYGALGGMLALVLCYGIDFASPLGGANSVLSHEGELLAASGIVGGLVYWAFAGRKAGLWKR